MTAPEGSTGPRGAIMPPTTPWRVYALCASLEEEARLHQLQAEVRSPTPSPESLRTRTDSDPDDEDDIEDWSETGSEKENKEDDYGCDKIISGTPNELKEMEELWRICDQAQKKERSKGARAQEPGESALATLAVLTDVGSVAERPVQAIPEGHVGFTEKNMEDSTARKGKGKEVGVPIEYETDIQVLNRLVSLQRKPDQLPGSCERCRKPYPATVGAGRLRRCLACDLRGIPDGGGGDASPWGKVTARYRRWRGSPYKHPSKNDNENENKDKDMAGRRKACLYRKREELFFDYHRVRRKETVRQMDEHSRRHRRLRRKRGRLVDQFITRLLSLQSKYQRRR